MESHIYNVDVTWNRDRRGMMCSPELGVDRTTNACIEVATPPEFPKGIAGIWSPEHLFTAAVSSCFMTTFLSIAENSGLAFKSFQCRAKGKLEKIDGKFLMTEVALYPVVTIERNVDKEKTERILTKSEQACLITNSIKAAVIMKPQVDILNSNTTPSLA